MIVYSIMMVIVIGLSICLMKVQNKNIKILCYSGIILAFFCVSGLRYDVGTDYFFRYVPNFQTIAQGEEVKSLEPLFIAIIKGCLLITDKYEVLFFITSFIINFLILITVFKNSKNILLSVLIFFVGSFFFQSMNLVRQYIAMSIMFASYKFLFNKKYIVLWILCVIAATSIHTMSLAFICAILLDKKVIKCRYTVIVGVIEFLFGQQVIEFILGLTQYINNNNITKYAHYVNIKGDLSLSLIIVEICIYIYLYTMVLNIKRNKKEITKELVFFMNAQTVTIFCTVLNVHIELFFRIALLYSVFQILSIPYVYELNKSCNFLLFEKYREKKFFNKILKFIKLKWKFVNISMLVVIMLLLTMRMGYSNIIKGADEILPYKTIFSSERI